MVQYAELTYDAPAVRKHSPDVLRMHAPLGIVWVTLKYAEDSGGLLRVGAGVAVEMQMVNPVEVREESDDHVICSPTNVGSSNGPTLPENVSPPMLSASL